MRAYELTEELKWAVGSNSSHAYGAIKNDLQNPDYTLVWVDIEDLFSKTGKDYRLDVKDPVGGKNSIGDRVARAKDFWMKGGYMNPSSIGWNDHFKTIDFGDGRHRLVAAYQLGDRWAPVLVDNESLDIVKELVKTK